jgi:hypothetical protein
MAPGNLTIGVAYYRLTFADAARTIPGVTPMIYVGVNIFSDDDPSAPVYYFQDTVSFSLLGSVASSDYDSKRADIEAQVFSHTESDLVSGIMTLDEIVSALTETLRRASWKH